MANGRLGKPCAFPRCPAIVEGKGGYCETHRPLPEAQPFAGAKRERLKLYGTSQWKRLRKIKLATNPVCEICGKIIASHVHHLEKARDATHRQFEVANLQALCVRCHARETQKETREKLRKGLTEK